MKNTWNSEKRNNKYQIKCNGLSLLVAAVQTSIFHSIQFLMSQVKRFFRGPAKKFLRLYFCYSHVFDFGKNKNLIRNKCRSREEGKETQYIQMFRLGFFSYEFESFLLEAHVVRKQGQAGNARKSVIGGKAP